MESRLHQAFQLRPLQQPLLLAIALLMAIAAAATAWHRGRSVQPTALHPADLHVLEGNFPVSPAGESP